MNRLLRVPHRILLLALVLTLIGLHLTARLASPADPPLRFDVTVSASEYPLTSKPVLTLTMTNISSAEVTVSAHGVGNIQAKIQLDGKPVPATTRPISFEEDPTTLRKHALVTLAPGEGVSIPFDLVMTDNGPILTTVRIGKTTHKAKEYALSRAGLYTVRLTYKYKGLDAQGTPNIYKRNVQSNEVTFRLR